MSSRNRLMFAVAAVGMLISAAAGAQEYPTKPITLIVPWPAGGSTDLTMRAIAESASKILGQPIAVDNKAGGGGTVGPATMAAAAKPDGYTIAQLPITVFRLPLMQEVSWDPAKDFSYIIHLTGYTFGVTTSAESQFKTWKDVIDFAKANPGKVTYATPGTGTSLHIGMEQIAKQAGGIKWTQVPFKGGAETNAEMAIEQLDEHKRDLVVICNAPVVEGAVIAATEASGGSSLASVRDAAEDLYG